MRATGVPQVDAGGGVVTTGLKMGKSADTDPQGGKKGVRATGVSQVDAGGGVVTTDLEMSKSDDTAAQRGQEGVRATGVPQVDAGGGVDVEVGPPLHHHHHLVARPSRSYHLRTGGQLYFSRGAVGIVRKAGLSSNLGSAPHERFRPLSRQL